MNTLRKAPTFVISGQTDLDRARVSDTHTHTKIDLKGWASHTTLKPLFKKTNYEMIVKNNSKVIYV